MKLSDITGMSVGTKFEVLGMYGVYVIREDCHGEQTVYDAMDDEPVKHLTLNSIISNSPFNIVALSFTVAPAQAEVLKAIYLIGGRFLAKDKSGAIYYYGLRPCKGKEAWSPDLSTKSPMFGKIENNILSSLLSFKDNHPLEISTALDLVSRTDNK